MNLERQYIQYFFKKEIELKNEYSLDDDINNRLNEIDKMLQV